MQAQMFAPFVLMALFGGYAIYSIRKRKAAMPEATRMFLERTGYRYTDILDKPLDVHIHHGEVLMKKAGSGGYQVNMMRDFHGIPVYSLQEVKYSGNTTSMSYSWTTPLERPPRILFQAADKSLGSMGKAVKEAFSSSERHWQQAYPHAVESGDAELDARFNFFGVDPQAVTWLLQQPGMRELLLGCAEVDLTVTMDRIAFADPMQKNIRAGMGGTVGMMAMGTNMAKIMELSIPVHDRVAELLATTARSAA